MRRILLTGATGFIGRSLLVRLLDQGDAVVAVVRTLGKLESHQNLREVRCDLALDVLPDLVLERCDVVLHVAHAEGALALEANSMFGVNVRATFQLLELARRLQAGHFCYISTGSVYGLGPIPFKETDACLGESFYARTKSAGESLVLGYGDHLDVSVLRLFAPYGPGQQDRLIPSLIEQVIRGLEISIPDDGGLQINPIYIQDCVTCVLDAIKAGPVGALNIGGSETVSIKTLVQLIGEVAGMAPVLVASKERTGGHVIGDISALRRDHRFSDPITGLTEGLRATLQEARSSGMGL